MMPELAVAAFGNTLRLFKSTRKSEGIMTCVRVLPAPAILLLSVLVASERPANAQGLCPAVGSDTNCGVVITVTGTGASVSFTGQPPYDGIEDQLVGVINNSSLPIRSLGLTSTLALFTFDGDGIDTYGIPGNGFDGTGYGGPNAYFTNITPDLTAGTVNFIVPIAANGGTAYFSLEEAITSATACSSLINNAMSAPSLGGGSFLSGFTNISATFTPTLGYSLSQAAQVCGFTDFDWIQHVTHLPDPSPFYENNPSNPSAPIHLTSGSAPFNDPAPNGYTYNPNWVSFPFYWDPKTTGMPWSLDQNKTAYTLSSYDSPADPCLSGPLGIPSFAWLTSSAVRALCGNSTTPRGSYLGFTTHLAGVNSDGTGADLGIGYTWTSNYNGTTGGVATTASVLPVDPGSGEGGITIVSVQELTNYNEIVVTTVNGDLVPAFVVPIEIKPPSAAPVAINPRAQGVIPVAILTTAGFDATTVDPASVRFGPRAAGNALPAVVQDVNGDGKPDLVLYFRSQSTGIACGDTTAVLSGQTVTGITFAGGEAIRTVDCK